MLAKFLCIPCLIVGDLLSYLAKGNTSQGGEIKQAMAKGHLVDDDLTLKILNEQLKSSSYEKGVVIDGFPRSLGQAQGFEFKVDRALYIKVSDEENTKRLLKRGRKDDTSQVIEKRLQVYHQETTPLLDFYKEKGLLLEINGERKINDIHQDILRKLDLG